MRGRQGQWRLRQFVWGARGGEGAAVCTYGSDQSQGRCINNCRCLLPVVVPFHWCYRIVPMYFFRHGSLIERSPAGRAKAVSYGD